MKTIIFSHQYGFGKHNCHTEEIEYDDDIEEKQIQSDYEDWVWNRIGDNFTWYEKE